MRSSHALVKCGILWGLLFLSSAPTGQTAPLVSQRVRLERVPHDGIQPQVAVGQDGTVHLIYFRGEPAAGDVFYCRRGAKDPEFSQPIRVNTEPGSVIATGTIRGAQLALGYDDRPHVAWNGSNRAQPRGPNEETPLLYTRLSDDGSQFEPQRNLIQAAYGLDGGACIAADAAGRVFVAWHAGEGRSEEERRVYMTQSSDNGRTFSPERVIDMDRVGACGCCGMRGTVGPDGDVRFLYRAAREGVNRDMYLLTSTDGGETFSSRKLDEWELEVCPMSSEAFAHTADSTWAAWETAEQVFVTKLSEESDERLIRRPAAGRAARRKHPALAVNNAGELLFVWTEGTGWNKGGGLAWQLFDERGRADPAEKGQMPGISTWSFAAAYAAEDGSFVILY
jgi:hypothetical protein